LLDNGDRRQRFIAVIKLGVSLAVLSGIFVGARVKAISEPDRRSRWFFAIVLPQNALDPFLSAGGSLAAH
jgi:hypothetical protein